MFDAACQRGHRSRVVEAVDVLGSVYKPFQRRLGLERAGLGRARRRRRRPRQQRGRGAWVGMDVSRRRGVSSQT